MPDIWTLKKVLDWAAADFATRGMESPRLEAELLLSFVLGCERIRLYTDFERPLDEVELARYREVISRRRRGEPAAYITGAREFWSLTFEVNRDVLVPRPDTETLVETALESGVGRTLLDLCTGSGCIVIALASECKDMRAHATDLSPRACEVARRNVARHSLQDRIEILEGDLFDAVPDGEMYDTIISNPPYVTSGEIPSLSEEVRSEPALALDGGADGLDLIRRILKAAPHFLRPAGTLLIELDPRQAEFVAGQLGEEALGVKGRTVNDLAGRPRVVVWNLR